MLEHCTPAVVARFWAKVRKTDTCWIWTGGRCGRGYGWVYLGSAREGDRYVQFSSQAHRLSWALHFGPIPEGKSVLHNCPDGDNPLCVNPAHLWLGTYSDNMRDMWAKGRHPVFRWNSASHPMAKLTPERVAEIRALRAAGEGWTHDALARKFGVARMTISRILSGEAWAS